MTNKNHMAIIIKLQLKLFTMSTYYSYNISILIVIFNLFPSFSHSVVCINYNNVMY